MFTKYEKAEQILKKYNQEHLLNFYNQLDENEQESLIEQILNIDFENIKSLYENKDMDVSFTDVEIEPIRAFDKSKIEESEAKRIKKNGEAVIKQGKIGVITMAGGQGTRLRTPRTKRHILFISR